MNMDALPQEIITKILVCLPYNDRRNLSLINSKWYHASLHPTLSKKQWFINRQNVKVDIEKRMIDCNNFEQTLIKSKRTFFNLKLYFEHNTIDPSIFEGLGNRIISLHLKTVSNFDNRFLNCITDGCNNLKSLTLEDSLMPGLNYNPRKILLNLQSLTFNNVYLDEHKFNTFMQCCPNLKNLGLLKTIFKNNRLCSGVINDLKNAKNINSLHVEDGTVIFMHLPAYIKLKNLTLLSSRPIYFDDRFIDIEELILLLSKQVSLEQLSIRYLPCCLLSAVSKLQNLKCLKLHSTTHSSQMCNNGKLCRKKFVESLSNMKKLKELSIIDWDMEQQSISSIPAIPDCTLRLLTSIDCLIKNRLKIVQFSNNLKSLHIQNAKILKSSDLHLIFNNFLNLEFLRLTNCVNLNDSIFEELPVSNLKELISLKFDGNITYKCLKYIKLLNLKYLTIKNMSITTISTTNLSDFEESLIQFGSFVPALFRFKLCIRLDEFIWTRENEIKLFNYEPVNRVPILPILKPYYTSLKEMVIDLL